MRIKSSLDVFLVALALVLLVIVGIGVLSRNNQPRAAVTASTSSGEEIAAAAPESAASNGLGSEFSGSGSDDNSTGDTSATLEEIAQPETASTEWDIVNGSFAIVRAIMNVNVRVGPGLDYGVIIAISPDTEVQVMRRSYDQDWIRVKLSDGREGWIFGQLLQLAN